MVNLNMLLTVWLVLLHILCPSSYTTIIKVEQLLKIHEQVKKDLALYINKEEEKLSIVKRNLAIFKKEHEKAMKDISSYVGHPINAFKLIKRLTSDLKHLKESVKIEKANIKREDIQYPSHDDMANAAQNLAKLQDTYELDVKELAEGKLKGVAYSIPMTAGDCYELGRLLYKESNYENIRYARAWLVEAYRKYNEDEMFYPFTQIDIIEHISMASSKMGDIESALKWTEVLLEVDPQHAQAKEIIVYFKRILAKETKLIKVGVQLAPEKEHDNSTLLQTTYKALCRGEMNIPAEISKRLRCHYLRDNHAFLILAPFKVEIMHLNPDVIFFHDVLSDGEIEAIKQMSTLKFTSNVYHESANDQHNVSAQFRDPESDTIARISRRVTHMTGLNVKLVKELNIINHRIGENYVLHYDFNNQNIEDSSEAICGDKMGTVLFYMSNVAHGGATVFPALGLSVFPEKGSAAFWLNLHASGEGDLATLHADCPVLQGSKWVATKWIYQCGEVFLRTCGGQKSSIVQKQPRSMSITSRERDFFEEYKKAYMKNSEQLTKEEPNAIN